MESEDRTAYAITCSMCKAEFLLLLDPAKVKRWEKGELIQNVFPELSSAIRELMISETCESCFKKLFADDLV